MIHGDADNNQDTKVQRLMGFCYEHILAHMPSFSIPPIAKPPIRQQQNNQNHTYHCNGKHRHTFVCFVFVFNLGARFRRMRALAFSIA